MVPKMRDTTKSTKKTPNKILAISTDVPAMFPKPKTPATSAIIKNVTAQLSIFSPF